MGVALRAWAPFLRRAAGSALRAHGHETVQGRSQKPRHLVALTRVLRVVVTSASARAAGVWMADCSDVASDGSDVASETSLPYSPLVDAISTLRSVFCPRPFEPADEAEFLAWLGGKTRVLLSTVLVSSAMIGAWLPLYTAFHRLLMCLVAAHSVGMALDAWWAKPALSLPIVGATIVACTILYTATLAKEDAVAEAESHTRREEAYPRTLLTIFFLLGFALAMQPRTERPDLSMFGCALLVRQMQLVGLAQRPVFTLLIQVQTWWLPIGFGFLVVRPAEYLARQLWAGRMALLHEMVDLHSVLASVEETRREQLVAKAQRNRRKPSRGNTSGASRRDVDRLPSLDEAVEGAGAGGVRPKVE